MAIVTVAGAVVSACIFSGHYVQNRKRFFASRPYDADLPAAVEHLLGELAAGRMEARLSKEDGLPVLAHCGRQMAHS